MTAFVSGEVQGVGFRWWTRAQALALGLVGSASNKADGRVEVVAEGPRSALEDLLARLREDPSTLRRPGRVTSVRDRWDVARGVQGFTER
ncbi:MAG: acylphosphatase [Janthinobacterium lividum]